MLWLGKNDGNRPFNLDMEDNIVLDRWMINSVAMRWAVDGTTLRAQCDWREGCGRG